MSHTQASIYQKVLDGSPLNNYELDAGITFHGNLARDLWKLGPTFALAAKECERVYQLLTDYKQARARK